MNIRLPKELVNWLDLVRGLKSRQSAIIDTLYKAQKQCDECSKNCKHRYGKRKRNCNAVQSRHDCHAQS